jgi:uncharacterized protein YcgL (UPF0745 family)
MNLFPKHFIKNNNNFVVTGNVDYENKTNKFLLKVDSNFNPIWFKEFSSISSQSGNWIVDDQDDYLFVGNKDDFSYVSKVSSTGELIWQKDMLFEEKTNSELKYITKFSNNFITVGYFIKNSKKYLSLIEIDNQGNILREENIEVDMNFIINSFEKNNTHLYISGKIDFNNSYLDQVLKINFSDFSVVWDSIVNSDTNIKNNIFYNNDSLILTNIYSDNLFTLTIFSDLNGEVLFFYHYQDIFTCSNCFFENKFISFIDNEYNLINVGYNNVVDTEILEINKLVLDSNFYFVSETIFDENIIGYFYNPFISITEDKTHSLNTIRACSNLKQVGILELDNFNYSIE